MQLRHMGAPRVSPAMAISPVLRERQKKAAARFTCGEHGKLTVREIAKLAGVQPQTIYNRLRAGVRGEALCASSIPMSERAKKRNYTHDYRNSCDLHVAASCQAAVGIRLALRYGKHAPSVEHLMDDYGMSRATAYRLRRAYRDALGEP